MLHPISAGPARDDDPGGKTVEMWQRLAVHFVSNERAVLQRLPDGNTLDEIRRLWKDRTIRSIEHNFDRLFLEADLIEHVL